MSGPHTITRRHLDRLAIVYVRQSTLTQVREHAESTARQYALAEEAARLGWNASAVVTIDTDLSRHGLNRLGFPTIDPTCSSVTGSVRHLGRPALGTLAVALRHRLPQFLAGPSSRWSNMLSATPPMQARQQNTCHKRYLEFSSSFSPARC